MAKYVDASMWTEDPSLVRACGEVKKNMGAASTVTGVSRLLRTHCEVLGRFEATSMLTGAPSLLRSYGVA